MNFIVGGIVAVIGLLMMFGGDTKKTPVHQQLGDSMASELEELGRIEKQLRDEVQR